MPGSARSFFVRWRDRTLVEKGTAGLVVAMVKFEPGAGNRNATPIPASKYCRNRGEGRGATEKEGADRHGRARIVYIPANEMHSHGGTKNSDLHHLSSPDAGTPN